MRTEDIDRLLDALLPRLPLLPRVQHDDVAGLPLATIIDQRMHTTDVSGIRKCALGCKSTLGMTAIIVEPCELSGYMTRFLDLCGKCHADVLELAHNWPGDDYVLRRLHHLRDAALQGTPA